MVIAPITRLIRIQAARIRSLSPSIRESTGNTTLRTGITIRLIGISMIE